MNTIKICKNIFSDPNAISQYKINVAIFANDYMAGVKSTWL